jgi:serine/threonine-protein kinase
VPTESQPAAGGIPGRPGMAGGGMVYRPPVDSSPGFVTGRPGLDSSPGFVTGRPGLDSSPGFVTGRPGLDSSPGFVTGRPGQMEKFPGILPTPGPPGGGMVPLPRGERPTFPGRPQIPGYQPPFTPIHQGPDIPGYRPPPQPGRMERFPGIIPEPTLRPMSYHPPPPIPHYGPDPGRGISMRPPPPIPHYGPDPGRGVGLPRGYPTPQNPYPAPEWTGRR